MRTKEQVDHFRALARAEMQNCKKCMGASMKCSCVGECELKIRAYEAGVPSDFWDYKSKDVKYNKEIFNEIVRPYARPAGLNTALQQGYGLLLLGDNGTGKTMFLSYVLMAVCRRNFTAFYTTMTQLSHDTKRGFDDRDVRRRLEWYLTSDFLAIDELAKERFKSGDSFIRTELERLLKLRYDDGRPTLLATNASLKELESFYGPTLTSMLTGKYDQVQMQPGDYRHVMRKKMKKDMKRGR